MSNKRTFFFILFLLLCAVLLGLNYVYQPFLPDKEMAAMTVASPSPVPSGDPDPATIDLSHLTPRQKVAGLLAAPVTLVADAPISASASAWLTANQPGAITIFGTRLAAEQVAVQVRALEASASTPTGPNGQKSFKPVIAIDHEGGTVQRLNGTGFTALPSWQSMCAQPATVSAQLLRASAQELKSVGVDLVFAPVADVALNHPVLRTRVCSDNQAEVIQMNQVYVEAMASAGVQSVIKHFPGIGQTSRDLHTNFDRVTIEPEEAKIYQNLLTKYPTVGVMVAHVGVTNQFPDVPCSLSPDCVGQVSANFPQVLIVSDALEMTAASFQAEPAGVAKSLPKVAEAAVRAGEQLLVFGPKTSWDAMTEVTDHLEQLYQTDPAFQRQVDRALNRLKQVPTL